MLFPRARLVRVIVFPGLILSLLVAISLLLATGILTRGPLSLATSVSNGDGTGSGTGTTLGTPVPLAQSFSTQLKGDYVAAGVGMRGTGPPGGGTIALPALPGGSTVEQAFRVAAEAPRAVPAPVAGLAGMAMAIAAFRRR